jgi:hypothetical protein
VLDGRLPSTRDGCPSGWSVQGRAAFGGRCASLEQGHPDEHGAVTGDSRIRQMQHIAATDRDSTVAQNDGAKFVTRISTCPPQNYLTRGFGAAVACALSVRGFDPTHCRLKFAGWAVSRPCAEWSNEDTAPDGCRNR